MSKLIGLPIRERWAARSAVLTKWLIDDQRFPAGSPVCEVSVDGRSRTIQEPSTFGADWCVYWSHVAEGAEIGPSGEILTYHDNLNTSIDPRLRIHPRARRRLDRRTAYPKVFVSYRREDTDAYAWRLQETLAKEFGMEDVFLDEFSIRPGENWAWTVQQAAAHCSAMVVVIGSSWLSVTDARGRRRIDSPSDFVAREVCAALDSGAHVCPLLVGNASVPTSQDLPDDLGVLTDFQFASARPKSWASDLAPLVEEIRKTLSA